MIFVNLPCRRLWLADLSRRSAATFAELENMTNALAELTNILPLTRCGNATGDTTGNLPSSPCLAGFVAHLPLANSVDIASRINGLQHVESSINRIVGRRMCKSQHMRWSRVGTHSVVQLRVALLNQEFHELARRQFPWIGQRRVTWPWQRTSQPF